LIWRFTDHGQRTDEPSTGEERPIAETDETSRRRCNFIYRACGCIILLSIALIGLVWLLPGGAFTWQRYSVLVLETVAIWAFSIAWFLKGSDYLKRAMG